MKGSRERTLLQRVREYAQARPDGLALAVYSPSTEFREITWGALDAEITAAAGSYAERGVARGDVVGIISPDPKEQAIAFFGLIACGATPTVLSFPSIKQPVERFLLGLRPFVERSGARYLTTSVALAEQAAEWLRAIGSSLRILPVDHAASSEPRAPDAMRGSSEAPLFVQFSSGTTGMRKGVAVTEAMLAVQARNFERAFELRADRDAVVSWVPLYHDLGLVVCLTVPAYLGIPSVHIPTFDWLREPRLQLDAIARYRGTITFMPNFAFSYLCQRIPREEVLTKSLSSLRAIVSGGEIVSADTWNEFLRHFDGTGLERSHLHVAYGMAENTAAVSTTSPGTQVRIDVVDREAFERNRQVVPRFADDTAGRPVTRFASCGRPHAGQKVRIAGTTLDRVVGEIEVRSPSLFSGYLGAENSTACFTADGFYKSGDLGYMLDGELFVVGRCHDMIIHRGRNLYPEDIERVVSALDGCRPGRAVVFGTYDVTAGSEVVVAMLEPEDGVDESDLRDRIQDAVGDHLGISLADIVCCKPGEILKSTSGKLSRRLNREEYLRNRKEGPRR